MAEINQEHHIGVGNNNYDSVMVNRTVINGGFLDSKKSNLKMQNNQLDHHQPHTTSISHSNSTSSSTSQTLFSNLLRSKSSIIGLPKSQNSCFIDCKLRKNSKPSKVRFFPKRSKSSSVQRPNEPSSPKVSCIGRVRSKKESLVAKSLSLRFRHRSVTDDITAVELTNTPKPDKNGFWSNVTALFRMSTKKKKRDQKSPPTEKENKKNVTALKHEEISMRTSMSGPPVLGGLKRFTSGRKSDSWVGCVSDLGEDDAEFCRSGND